MSNSGNIYLNTAACGLVTDEVREAGNQLYKNFATNSSKYAEQWRMEDEGRIRETIGSFIGAPASNIAMVPNFSWAMNGIIQSLHGNEKVLLCKKDYPSIHEPFIVNKFDITWIDVEDGFTISIDQIESLIKEKNIDLLVLSHVQWSSGFKLDIARVGKICKQYGVVFIVDATQSMGAIPIDLSEWHVDVFIASNYKWMNAGFGTGVMYISNSFLSKYPPVVCGHNSYKVYDDKWMYVASAQSYEPGHPNMFGLTVLEAAINDKLQRGVANIEAHNRALTELLLKEIKDLPVTLIGDYSTGNRASIVFLKDTDGLGEHIKKNGITITHRNGMLRISIHYYNTEHDVLTFAECLRRKYNGTFSKI